MSGSEPGALLDDYLAKTEIGKAAAGRLRVAAMTEAKEKNGKVRRRMEIGPFREAATVERGR